MFCPVCNYKDSKVIDSRVINDGMSVRRRRECPKCNFRFSTYEQTELLDLTVVKRDGRREPYYKEKIEAGLKKSLEKRSFTQEQFYRLIAQIERSIQKLKKPEVTSGQIGEIIMKHLKKFDKVAYIRFASVYQQFEDVKKFQKEVSSLIKKGKR